MNRLEQLPPRKTSQEGVPSANRPDDAFIEASAGGVNTLDRDGRATEHFTLKEQALYDAIESLGNEPVVAEIEAPDATLNERYTTDTMQVLREAVFSVEILRSANQQNRPIAELLQKAVENGRLPRMLQAKRALGEYLKLDPKISTAINAMADAAEAYRALQADQTNRE